MRFVFVVRSRRGLGHVVRATCVAEALSELHPDAEIVLAVSHQVPDELTGRVTSHVVLGQDLSADRLRGFEPDVVFFDTVVPAAWRSWCELQRAPRLALMMREMTSAALASLRQHPVFSLLDRILIPHPASEFDPVKIERVAAQRRKYETYQSLISEAKALSIPILNQNRFLVLVGYYQR